MSECVIAEQRYALGESMAALCQRHVLENSN